MKKISFFALALGVLTVSAQNKIDFTGRMAIDRMHEAEAAMRNGMSDNGLTAKATNDVLTQRYSVIVEFDENGVDFGDLDVETVTEFDDMAIVSVTAQEMEAIAELPQVVRVSLGNENKPMMYKARPATGVDAVQAGTDGLSKKYTGAGVVTGVFDTGLDVNHINFLNAAGEPRTKSLWVLSSSGSVTSYTTPAQISSFTTEDSKETHGTHVLGIMAGGYSGPGTYATIASSGRGTVTQQDATGSSIPFYGVATESDLAVGCGTLSDGNILAASQRIANYAKSQNKPCVINLSLGNNLGPHDGTDAMSKALAKVGQDAIICISAGNEGDENISISTDYGDYGMVKTIVCTNTRQPSIANGTLQFWASDDQVFNLRFIGYNPSSKKEVFSYYLGKNLAGGNVQETNMSGFGNAFSGKVTISSNIDPGNNRYNVSVSLNVTGLSGVLAAFEIEAAEGQVVDGFASSLVFTSNSRPGFTDGSPDNSINGLACGENVLVVGSYATAAEWAVLPNGGLLNYSPKPQVGGISSFSSYGYTPQGRFLPDICAPGEVIISSYSRYYYENAENGMKESNLAGIYYTTDTSKQAKNSPWAQMQGTSMSSPFAAGVVALWLEADPTLTVAKVKEVLEATSVRDVYVENDPIRWGAGKINALEGIKYVLNHAGVNDVAVDTDDVFVTKVGDKRYEVFVSGANGVDAKVYSLTGSCVARATGSGDTAVVSAESAQPGVYVLSVETDKGRVTRKVAL